MVQLARDERKRLPKSVASLIKRTYADDIGGGANTLSESLETAQQMKYMCAAGQFPLAKWLNNCPKFLGLFAAHYKIRKSSRKIVLGFWVCPGFIVLFFQEKPKITSISNVSSRSSGSLGKATCTLFGLTGSDGMTSCLP